MGRRYIDRICYSILIYILSLSISNRLSIATLASSFTLASLSLHFLVALGIHLLFRPEVRSTRNIVSETLADIFHLVLAVNIR